MLINKKINGTSRVKFISYDGEYPNLCRGVLTLEIDGVQYKFGHHYRHFNCKSHTFDDELVDSPNFGAFWTSGGSVRRDEGWNWDIEHNEWAIDCESLDPKFWDVAAEIDAVFNENVPYGCCGGCI